MSPSLILAGFAIGCLSNAFIYFQEDDAADWLIGAWMAFGAAVVVL